MIDKKESTKEVKLAVEALDEKKGENICVIDISKISILGDYFVITNGTNSTQVQALANNVEEKLVKKGYLCKQMEGYRSAHWIVLDFGSVIVHIFDAKNRAKYDLEHIWRDGVFLDVKELLSYQD